MIEIVPLCGVTKVRHGRTLVDKHVTTDIDNIMDGKYCIGHIKRVAGAPICLTERVSASTEAEIRKAVDARDRKLCDEFEPGDRRIARPPNIPEELLEE